MFRPPETFETARLTARIPRATDAAAVYAAYASDLEVARYLSWKAHPTVESAAEFLQTGAAGWQSGRGLFPWVLCHRGTDIPIGSIGVIPDGRKVALGFVLAKAYWNQGLMTEAARWVVQWAVAQPELDRVWAFCDVENPASARVMEKAGMAYEGILRRWHVCPNIGPESRDCLVYARVREFDPTVGRM